jgi:hypothetical protein
MKFQFNGDWETTLGLDALKGFQSRKGWYGSIDSDKKSDGVVRIVISDELNDDPDPAPEQINAINYILENQEAIVKNILQKIYEEYPALKNIYGSTEEEDEFFPALNSPEDLKRCIGFHTLFVLLPHKDGIAYIGFEGGCTWDDEHGIGLVLHKDRVISFGAADEAFSSWKAWEDNGTLEERRRRQNELNGDRSKLPRPIKYLPHPKYGKLKPSQEDANKGYEYHLIERGYNEEFISLIESGQRTVNDDTGWISMTFLERACQFQNKTIIRYILSKNPISIKNCIQSVATWRDEELLNMFLKKGAHIDEANNVGETALSRQVSLLMSCYQHKSTEAQISECKQTIEWLLAKGADPFKTNSHGENAFARLSYSSEKEKLIDFLEKAVAKVRKKKRWWSW